MILFLCTFITGLTFAQNKYSTPVRTAPENHYLALQQLWAVHSAGIHFAKTHGTTPYEYGKYVGNLFAPSWDEARGYDGYVKGVIFNLETFRVPADGEMEIIENCDRLVSIKFPAVAFKKFFPEGRYFITFDEFCQAMNGMFEPLAGKMGATTNVKNTGEWLIFEIRKKS